MVVAHPTAFGWPVVGYLVLSGLGGGALCAGAASGLSRRIARVAAARRGVGLGLTALALGALLLVTDLARPERFVLLFLHAGRRSVIALGVRALTAALLFGACTLFFLTREEPRARSGRIRTDRQWWATLAATCKAPPRSACGQC